MRAGGISRRELLAAALGSGASMSRMNADSPANSVQTFPVTLRVDMSRSLGALRPVWRFFGCDEPNYAYAPHGRKVLGELGRLGSAPTFFRAHNLLTTGDGTPALKWGSTNAYREEPAGNAVYDWTILDRIFDTYRECRIRPYAQIGFMPQALSVRPEPYQHHWRPGAPYDEIFTGWAYPPKDYARWAELVYRWVSHCVERYGRAEVQGWYWEVWNEPNIGYWRGTPEEFYRLHDFAVDAVRRALPAAKVGGPDVAGSGGSFMRGFLDHCLRGKNFVTGRIGTPLDFVSFHAKGAPEFVDGHVRMGISNHLRTVDAGFSLIAAYPELKQTPVIIGESDPDGCAACRGPQLGYRDSSLYSSYVIASIARIIELAERRGVNLEGVLTWAFEFEDQPYFAGLRQLATNGIDLPALNAFRLLGRLSGDRLAVDGSHGLGLDAILRDGVRHEPDVAATATLDGSRLAVLVWHYHDDDVVGSAAAVELTVAGLTRSTASPWLRHLRVDERHGNAHAAWVKMGSPAEPTAHQYRALERASRVASLPIRAERRDDGAVRIGFTLPRQAVSLIEIEW